MLTPRRRPQPDEPAMAAVIYVQLPRNERTAAQWAACLTADLEVADLEVVIEPAGERAVIIFWAADGSLPPALERAVNRLISDSHSFGLIDAARTQPASD